MDEQQANAVAGIVSAINDGFASPEKPWFDLRPDAQGFDEIRIVTVPRYKTSGLSGDEWRISARVDFYRKGVKVHEDGCRDVETAAGMLYGMLMRAQDDGKAFFGGDGIHCDQEGCPEIATVRYRKLFAYCREAHKTETHRPTFRHFCEKHKRRGDCGFEDSDVNYTEVPMKD